MGKKKKKNEGGTQEGVGGKRFSPREKRLGTKGLSNQQANALVKPLKKKKKGRGGGKKRETTEGKGCEGFYGQKESTLGLGSVWKKKLQVGPKKKVKKQHSLVTKGTNGGEKKKVKHECATQKLSPKEQSTASWRREYRKRSEGGMGRRTRGINTNETNGLRGTKNEKRLRENHIINFEQKRGSCPGKRERTFRQELKSGERNTTNEERGNINYGWGGALLYVGLGTQLLGRRPHISNRGNSGFERERATRRGSSQ